MRTIFLHFFCAISSLLASEKISGFWKSLDDQGAPQCVFGVYEYEGIYYGRVIGSYNEEGKMEDTLYKPIDRADGVAGQPHVCGLDILYDFQDNGSSFDGRIVDPKKGKVYRCEMWREAENLIVRGKLLIFGKSLTWYPATTQDFPEGFALPDMKKFVPNVPQL